MGPRGLYYERFGKRPRLGIECQSPGGKLAQSALEALQRSRNGFLGLILKFLMRQGAVPVATCWMRAPGSGRGNYIQIMERLSGFHNRPAV